MAYIGNQQTVGFSKIPPKQDLTGATGSSLTLSHAVSSPESIDLFINHVRQEPTESYTTDGTTVNLVGYSVAATDDIYVVYNSLAQQTSTHPSNQALQATTGTFSGALSATTGTFSGDLTVDTDTLYVDSTNNRVGIGTSSPSQKLVTKASSTNLEILNTVQNSNGGAGIAAIGFNVSDASTEGDFTQAGIGFVRGVANGGGALAFYNKSDGATGNFTTANERMRIDSGGDILANTTSAGISNSLSTTIETRSVNKSRITVNHSSGGSSNGSYFMQFGYGGNRIGSITQNSTSSVAYNTSSDHRLKENVVADWDATTRLKQLNPVRFNFIADADTTVDGFLAHEVQSVVPEAISGTKDAVDDDGNPEYQGIDQSKLVPLLVKTIQELEARVAALENA